MGTPVAHSLLFQLVDELSSAASLPTPVVEFGSLQVEADQPNDLRPIFAGAEFLGTDFRDGPGVDQVEDLRSLTFDDGSVGTALCLETLEHCEDPFTACRELHRVVSPEGGICLISSVMLIGIHGYPNDYWRFTPEGFRVLLKDFDDVDVGSMGHPESPFFVFGLARRGGELPVRFSDFKSLADAQDRYERAEGKIKLGPMRYTLRELGRELGPELPRVVAERARAKLR